MFACLSLLTSVIPNTMMVQSLHHHSAWVSGNSGKDQQIKRLLHLVHLCRLPVTSLDPLDIAHRAPTKLHPSEGVVNSLRPGSLHSGR